MKRGTIIEIIAALFILLFVYTASSKLLEMHKFQYTIAKSPLIGDFANLISWAVPITEISIAIILLIPKTRLVGLYASTALMAIFTLYIGYMIAFTPKLPCSCGGVIKYMSWNQHLLFNIFFTLLGVWGIMLLRKNNKQQLAEVGAVRLKTKYSL